MRRTIAIFVILLASTLVWVGASLAVAGAQQPIGPNQHFTGLVNGRLRTPVVYTVCPGPTWPGRTGPVAGGQTMSVRRATTGRGYTGLFSRVDAWFVPPAATATMPIELILTKFGVPQSIPSAVRVPCDGSGMVEFSPCPNLAPCAYGWVPDFVNVRFVNIAV